MSQREYLPGVFIPRRKIDPAVLVQLAQQAPQALGDKLTCETVRVTWIPWGVV